MIPRLLDQYVEEIAILWWRRHEMSRQPHIGLAELLDADLRLEALLDGLQLAGDEGWQVALEEMAWGDEGEVFAPAVLAWTLGDDERWSEVLAHVQQEDQGWKALRAAALWLPWPTVRPAIEQIMADDELARPWAIEIASLHGHALCGDWSEYFEADDPRTRSAAARACGWLHAHQHIPRLDALCDDPDENVRGWAAWSLLNWMNQPRALTTLREVVTTSSAEWRFFWDDALLAHLDPVARHAWLHSLSANGVPTRRYATLLRWLGDPRHVSEWLDWLDDPLWARAAGEGLTQMTGQGFEYAPWEGAAPEGFSTGPSDDPDDDDVAVDPDLHLPWPQPDVVRRWWPTVADQYVPGQRYLGGYAYSQAPWNQLLRHGRQRVRFAAAAIGARHTSHGAWFDARGRGVSQLLALDAIDHGDSA